MAKYMPVNLPSKVGQFSEVRTLKSEGGSVTQLAAALCEDRTKVILVSDRMHEPEIIEQTRTAMKGKGRAQEIAEILSEKYRQVRTRRVEHEILEEVGIASFSDFYDKQRFLQETIIIDLWKRMREYDLGVHFLLGAVDEKAHIYYVCEPGTYRSFDEVVFCCVGSGDRHAEPVFAFYGFSPKLSEQEVLQIAFEAKKRAEMAGGVGSVTDAWIVEKGGIYEVHPETILELENHHKQQESTSRLLGAIETKKKKLEC